MPTLPPYLSWLRPSVILATFGLTLWLLSWMQPVLIPIALAVLFTFLLAPLVTLLQQRHFSRVVAVTVVVILAAALIGGIGWLVVRQVTTLVDAFPQYELNLNKKIAEVSGDAGFIDKAQRIVRRVTAQIEKKTAEGARGTEDLEGTKPLAVRVVEDSGTFQLRQIWSGFGPVLEPLASVGLAVVLLTFMLIRREDLRDRIISLVGHGRLTLTTKALDEAGQRISRYLLMQLIVNGSYGIVIGIGLYFIGVPYALLWGFFAFVLRYIPYIGPWLAAVLPIGLSVLASENWSAMFLVFGLFLMLELVSNMVIEPMLYGRGIGVSETATLVMIAFWTWLWGPIGLILATPLTVCLVVLAKYVPFLKFVDTLLGDLPALAPHIGFYQRLLARDQDEASDIAEDHLKANSLQHTFDELLIPALTYAKFDVAGDNLTEDDQRYVFTATREIVEELATLNEAQKEPSEAVTEPVSPLGVISILGCPARDEADEIGLLMLKELLTAGGFDVKLTTAALMASEVVALVEEEKPALLCIAALPPGGAAHTRLLCLRLRGRFPGLKIIVGRWGYRGDADKARAQLLQAGADQVATNLADTYNQIVTLAALVSARPAEGQRDSTLSAASFPRSARALPHPDAGQHP